MLAVPHGSHSTGILMQHLLAHAVLALAVAEVGAVLELGLA